MATTNEKLRELDQENALVDVLVDRGDFMELRELVDAGESDSDADLIKLAIKRIKGFEHRAEMLKGQLDLWLKG